MYSWGERSLKRMLGVNPMLVLCATNALKNSSDDMTIPWMGGRRSAEDQNKIFLKGNSTLDGYEKKSYHQSGNALDIIPVSNGYHNTDAFLRFADVMFSEWQKIIRTGRYEMWQEKEVSALEYTLEWGGFWTRFNDKPHWQIVRND